MVSSGTTDLNMLNEVGPIAKYVCEEIMFMKNESSNLRNGFSTFKTEIKQQIKEDYSKINRSLENIFRVLGIGRQSRSPREIAVSNPKQDLLQNVKFPLASCEEISLLEEKIRNKEFRTQLIEFLSNIGGRTGVEDGSKIAYKIVDYVFTSEVLMQYSWTGVSRGTSSEKKSFQMLDGIVGVFFEVVSLADNRHTKEKNCTIFKDGVLKHAKKRAARKRSKPTDALPDNNLVTDENEVYIKLETNDTEAEVDRIGNDAENT